MQDGARTRNGIVVAGRGNDHRRSGGVRSQRDVIGGDGAGSSGDGGRRAGYGLLK